MKQFKFDLQMFDDEPEIPAELGGVDPAIAREVMAEAGLSQGEEPAAAAADKGDNQGAGDPADDQTGKTGEDGAGSAAEQSGVADTDTNQQAGDEQPSNNEPSNVPYKRFKEVNDKSKAKDTELATLRAELDALRAQRQAANTNPQQQQNAPAAQPQQVNEADVIAQVTDQAIANALKRVGMTEAELAELEYSDDPDAPKKKMRFQTAYNLEVNRMITDANSLVEKQRQELERRQTMQQTVNTEYVELVNQYQAQENFDAYWKYTAEEKFSSLPPFERQVLKEAFDRTQNGNGSPQDLLMLKNYFAASRAEFTGKQVPNAAPAKLNKTNVEQRLKQMESHPKADQVHGTDTQDGQTLADLERIIQTTDSDKWPDWVKQAVGLPKS